MIEIERIEDIKDRPKQTEKKGDPADAYVAMKNKWMAEYQSANGKTPNINDFLDFVATATDGDIISIEQVTKPVFFTPEILEKCHAAMAATKQANDIPFDSENQ